MQRPCSNGFSVVEMLVVVAVLGSVASATISVSGNEWQRERVNAAAVELAGWLETVRRASLKGNACQVTITGGSLTAGATMATAQEIVGASAITNNCLSSQPLPISGSLGSASYSIRPGGSTSFKFTPRGTVNAGTTNAQLTSPIVIEISLAGGTSPLRCVRISEGLGLISVGSSSTSTGTCPAVSYGKSI